MRTRARPFKAARQGAPQSTLQGARQSALQGMEAI
jgi:hypothetical protein